ncbi:phosphotransferase [Marinovum sp. KMM 9879]
MAVDVFHHLAAQAGLDAGAYAPTRHWLKDNPQRLHLVMRFDAPRQAPLILKQVFRPEDPREFNGMLDAQAMAWQALKEAPNLTVPRILAEDRALKACLMAFQPGETLRDLCLTHEDHTPFLRQAGRWLAAFHRGTFQQNRKFRPHFMADHMLHLAAQIETGERRIRGQRRFIDLARRMPAIAADHEGGKSRISAKHGDINCHNILIEGASVAGYDFMPARHAPVGYDIARLLLSYAITAADLEAIPSGQMLPPAAMEAFFEGYDFVRPEDPSVQFLLRIQVLTEWNRTANRKGAQALIEFERLKVIAQRAFG